MFLSISYFFISFYLTFKAFYEPKNSDFGENDVEVGIGLIGFGILFSFLGVILFFDRGLLALGNVRYQTLF